MSVLLEIAPVETKHRDASLSFSCSFSNIDPPILVTSTKLPEIPRHPRPASRALRERARGRERGVPGEAARSRHGSPRDKSEVCIIMAPVDWPQHVDKTVRPRLCSSPAPSASRILREGGPWSRWCASVVRRWCVRVGAARRAVRGDHSTGGGEGDTTGRIPPRGREGFPSLRRGILGQELRKTERRY